MDVVNNHLKMSILDFQKKVKDIEFKVLKQIETKYYEQISNLNNEKNQRVE